MSKVTNKKLQAEFEKIKDSDEVFIWGGKPHFISFLSNMIASGVIGLILLVAVIKFNQYAAESENRSFNYALIILGIIFIPGILAYLKKFFSYRNTVYAYTNKKILMKSGLVGTNFKMIDLDKLIDIEISISPIDKLYSTGTIKFFSGRTKQDDEGKITQLYDDWYYIEEPHKVIKGIKKAMQELKES